MLLLPAASATSHVILCSIFSISHYPLQYLQHLNFVSMLFSAVSARAGQLAAARGRHVHVDEA